MNIKKYYKVHQYKFVFFLVDVTRGNQKIIPVDLICQFKHAPAGTWIVAVGKDVKSGFSAGYYSKKMIKKRIPPTGGTLR